MKQHLKLFIISLITVSALALVSYAGPLGTIPAYGPTSGSDNGEYTPITIGAVPQVKAGGLTIGAPFQGRGNAILQGNTYLQGMVRGGNPGVVDSTILFGNAPSTTVSVDATGNVSAEGSMQTASLATAAGGKVCADVNGTLVLCPPTIVTCPVGQIADPNGNCIPAPCVAHVVFHGNFRWGSVEYIAPAPAQHPGLTVTVTLEGLGNGTQASGDPREVIFTMPSNSSISYTNGSACAPGPGAGSGCEIEGTYGFAFGYTSHVTPNHIPGGLICVEQG